MTAQEAIKQIEKNIAFIRDVDCTEYDMAIEALEKQIPNKVLYREQSYVTPWMCPECEADQIKVEFFREDGYEPKDKHSYCWKCGRKLDWGE